MGKNNKINRRSKKNLKRKKQTNDRKFTSVESQSSSGSYFSELSNPFSSLNDDERKILIDEIQKNSRQQIEDSLVHLQDLIKHYDPLTLLCILGSYAMVAPVSKGTVKNITNENTLNQSSVEYFQGLILRVPQNEWGKYPPTPEVVQTSWTELNRLANSLSMSNMDSSRLDVSTEEKAIYALSTKIRGYTQVVRNWGYYSQVLRISQDLYSVFDSKVTSHFNFSISQVILLFQVLIKITEKKLNNRFSILRKVMRASSKKEMIKTYYRLLEIDEADAEKFIESYVHSSIDKRMIFGLLMSHYDLRSDELYEVSISEIAEFSSISKENIEAILATFSLCPGSTSDHPLDHLALNNPIWTKPIIQIEGKFYCPIPQLFFSFIFPILDGLIEKIDKDELHQRRSGFLESSISKIVKTRFPEANTIINIKWREEGVAYENDLITIIDSQLLIFEAKSQRITSQALRGAPDRLKKHIQEIIVDPSIQSKRLENKLNELRLNPEIKHSLRKKIPVDLSAIKVVKRVSVTLDSFGIIESSVNDLRQAGWLPQEFEPCPTMNLADFETVFDLLEHPVQILHYLTRRAEIHSEVDFQGDELDILGLYLDSMLENHEIYDRGMSIFISGMSSKVDDYYNSLDAGIKKDKPAPKTSKLFKSVFNQLERRKIPRWTEIGVMLNRFSPKDQVKIAQHINDQKNIVNITWRNPEHKNMLIYSPPESSSIAFSYVMYKDANAKERSKYIEKAAELALAPEHVKQCLVIAKNIDRNESAYDFIALCEPHSF